MSESTLHLKVEGQRACVVCGADLGRRVSRWWLVNCWTADPKHYRSQQTSHPSETVRPCGVLARNKTPNARSNLTRHSAMTTEATQDAPTLPDHRTAVAGQVERRVRRPEIRDYSEAELLAELARRRGLREDKMPTRWCDECQHFAASDDAKLTKNPCTKSHAMHFIMPESAGDYEWGYYRRWCSDWTPNGQLTG